MKIDVLTMGAAEIEQAMVSPSAIFDLPAEVVTNSVLTLRQKIEILKRWALDARQLQIATEENMGGGEPPMLDEVNEALSALDPKGEAMADFEKAPTKI